MHKHVNPTQAKRVLLKGKQTPKPTVDGDNFAKKTDERFYLATPYPNFNVDCDVFFQVIAGRFRGNNFANLLWCRAQH